MTWSFARARQASAEVRAAPEGASVLAAVRPRGIFGIVRARPPLPLLLFIAARDGLVVDQDNGGFAMLRCPVTMPCPATGGYLMRLLRSFDRHWELWAFAAPAAAGLLVAALATALRATVPGAVVAIVAAAACAVWAAVFMTGGLIRQLHWLGGLGRAGRPQAVADEAARHWQVSVFHQPDSGQVDALVRQLRRRLAGLIGSHLQESAGEATRISGLEVGEPLVVLASSVTTGSTRQALADSLRALPHSELGGDVIVLAPPVNAGHQSDRVPAGGGFLLLYLAGLAVVIAVCSAFVAGTERAACLPASCQGRPAGYSSALRFLLQRLLLSDPRGLSPATTAAIVIGWLVSIAGLMLVAVAFVAVRQEVTGSNLRAARHDAMMMKLSKPARVLILVVTQAERDAVLDAVGERVGRAAVVDQDGELTVYSLGRLAGAQVSLVQAGEQGTSGTSGMFATAGMAIALSSPDYVILAGICFGLRPDQGQRLGDIVVASRMQNIDHRKLTDHPGQLEIIRGVNVGASAVLLDRFLAAQVSWTGAPVHVGLVLSSNTLVNSSDRVADLRRAFPDAIAGEMECTAVHGAAMTAPGRPDWIMVKAISDWGYGKSDGSHQVAARNAADLVVAVIASDSLRPRTR